MTVSTWFTKNTPPSNRFSTFEGGVSKPDFGFSFWRGGIQSGFCLQKFIFGNISGIFDVKNYFARYINYFVKNSTSNVLGVVFIGRKHPKNSYQLKRTKLNISSWKVYIIIKVKFQLSKGYILRRGGFETDFSIWSFWRGGYPKRIFRFVGFEGGDS